MTEFNTTWKAHFSTHRIAALDKRWIKQSDLGAALKLLPEEIERTVLGHSSLGRPIYKLKVGSGDKPVLAWAAMHGNETTALRGWLDLLKNINAEPVKAYFKDLLKAFTIHFIPVLNPDGAENYTRRNALGIDMNRDARALQSSEMQVLLNELQSLKPHLAFNLHDQRNIFSIQDMPATISFLAPSIDESRTITAERARTMDLIAHAAAQIAPMMTGAIGRYTDEYYPTAIGERIQQESIPTILVECGPSVNDQFRQEARMVNGVILHAVLKRFLENESPKTEKYLSIPVNEKNQVDILIKGMKVEQNGHSFIADLALLAEESIVNGRYTQTLKVHDFGDLRTRIGLETYEWKQTLILGSTKIGATANLEITTAGKRLKIEDGQVV